MAKGALGRLGGWYICVALDTRFLGLYEYHAIQRVDFLARVSVERIWLVVVAGDRVWIGGFGINGFPFSRDLHDWAGI